LLATPDLSVPMVVALADEPRTAVEAMLEQLVDAQLLETLAPGRYRMHDLLRLFAQELVDQEESQASCAAAHERVMAWQVATTRLAVRLAYPGDQWRALGDITAAAVLQDQADAFAWLEVERPNLLAIGRQAATTHATGTMVGPLAAALFRYLQMGGYWTDLRTLNEVALQVARDAGDRSGEAQALSDLATASWWLGEFDHAVAYNQVSLDLRRALGDRRGESLALGNLSEDYRTLGRLDEALACQRQSLAIIRELGDRPAEARSLNGLGLLSETAGRFHDAAAWYEQALVLFREVGDRASEGTALRNLAEACVRAGDPRHAVGWARDAAMVCHEAGNREGEARALHWLGAALNALGDLGPARAAWQAARTLYTTLDMPEAEELRQLLDEAGVGARSVPHGSLPRR
jgi:tetratricopeptide (TPR) repeat protein